MDKMTMGRVTFGQLHPETPGTFRNVNDDAQIIAALTAKVQAIEAQNAKLLELVAGLFEIAEGCYSEYPEPKWFESVRTMIAEANVAK